MKFYTLLILSFVISINSIGQKTRGDLLNMLNEKNSLGEYHIIIFTEEEYKDESISDLSGPKAESERLMHVLEEKYQFKAQNIHAFENAQKNEILTELDALSKQLKEKDNLIIYYSGHGAWNENERMGYWLPSDFERGDWQSAISNDQIKNLIDQFKSRHVLLISDACFSGSIFKSRGISEMNDLEERLYMQKSRKAMTSGMLQKVPEKSVFMEHLIDYLEINKNKFLLVQDLFYSIQKDVALTKNHEGKTIVPLYASITGCDDQDGQFIFINESGVLSDEIKESINPTYQKLALANINESVSLGKIFQFPETPIEYLGNARIYNMMGMPNESAKAYLNYFSLSVNEHYLEPHLEYIDLLNEVPESYQEEYIRLIEPEKSAFFQFLRVKVSSTSKEEYFPALNAFIDQNAEFSFASIDRANALYDLYNPSYTTRSSTVFSEMFPVLEEFDLDASIKESKKYFLRPTIYFDNAYQEKLNELLAFYAEWEESIVYMFKTGFLKEGILTSPLFHYSPKTEEERAILSEKIDNVISHGDYPTVSLNQLKGTYIQVGENRFDTRFGDEWLKIGNRIIIDSSQFQLQLDWSMDSMKLFPEQNLTNFQLSELQVRNNTNSYDISSQYNLDCIFTTDIVLSTAGNKLSFSGMGSCIKNNYSHNGVYYEYFEHLGNVQKVYKNNDEHISVDVNGPKELVTVTHPTGKNEYNAIRLGNWIYLKQFKDFKGQKIEVYVKAFEVSDGNESMVLTDNFDNIIPEYSERYVNNKLSVVFNE